MASAVDRSEQYLPEPSPSAVDPYIQPTSNRLTVRTRAGKS
jgi:hypothetical protein